MYFYLPGNGLLHAIQILCDQFTLNTWFFRVYVSFVIPITVLDTTVQMIRIWLLYFDMQLSQSIRNHNWRMAINPTSVTDNWFLNPINQRLFGDNGKYLFFIGFCINIIEMTFFWLLIFGFNKVLFGIILLLAVFVIKVSL